MSKKMYITIISIAVLLILALLCVIGVVYFQNNTKSGYDKHISVARQYIEKQDYVNAIIEYEEALKINNNDEDAYIGIAEAYIAQHDITQAVKYLRQGYDLTGSETINKMLLQYEPLAEGAANVHYTLAEVIEGSSRVTLNKDLFTVFRIYTYEQYNTIYTVNASSLDNIIIYDGIPAKFTYSSAPSASDKPISVEATEVSFLFNGFTKGVSYDRLKELDIFNLNFLPADSNNGRNAIEFDLNGCHVMIETDENGNIVDSAPWNAITFTSSSSEKENATVANVNIDYDAPSSEEGNIVLKGTAYNEAKGNAGGKVKVKIYTGEKANSGNLLQEFTTTAEGKYRLELIPDTYYVEAIVDKEVVFEDKVELDGTKDVVVFDMPYSYAEQLRVGEIRVVLSWPDKNANLDHILEGVNSDGNYVFCSHGPYDGGFHEHFDYDTGELVISSGAEMTGGPEEITVYDIGGSYQYYVDSYYGDSIAGAVVEVYTSDSSTPVRYECPSDFTGMEWNVFTYENGDVKAAS